MPVPTPRPLDVIVEMKASGMCGTDLQNYRRASDQPPYMPPLIDRSPIAGHEPAGVISEVGALVSRAQARVGQRVMVHHYQGCNSCELCRSGGWQQLCQDVKPIVHVYRTMMTEAMRNFSRCRRIRSSTCRTSFRLRRARQFHAGLELRAVRSSVKSLRPRHHSCLRSRTGGPFGDAACACDERACNCVRHKLRTAQPRARVWSRAFLSIPRNQTPLVFCAR